MFSGRIGRLGFLLGHIYVNVPFIVIILVYALVNALVGDMPDNALRMGANIVLFLIGLVWILLSWIVSIDLAVRRWHDLGQTGWLVLLSLLPVVNLIVILVQLIVPGNPGPNRYGVQVSGLGVMQVLFHKYPASSASVSPVGEPLSE